MMRIVVTGASGFLGSYVTAELVHRGHNVAVLLRDVSSSWRLSALLPRLFVIRGSVDELEQLRDPLKNFSPDAVVHMAWRGVGNMDHNSPLQARNAAYSVELAALTAEVGGTAFIGAGSQAEYGPYGRPIQEDDALRPVTLYGKAKVAAYEMAAHVAASRGMRLAWLRIFSTYGPKDAPHWLIPSMISALRQGRRMALTRCEQRWGFLHARDAAAAFCIAVENSSARGVYNVGSPDAPTLRDTVTLLRDLINPRAELGFGELAYRPDQVMVLQADIRRLMTLGWTPLVSLEAGLRETAQVYGAD